MRKTPLQKAPKDINCKECGVQCKSGKSSLCNTCYAYRAKAKREKAKKEKKALDRKLGNVSDDKLWDACAELVKVVYPLRCHGHVTPIKLEPRSKNTHACHFVAKAKAAITAYDIRNILPGCGYCNFFDQAHVHQLGKWIDYYWGENTAEEIRELSNTSFKLTQATKNELHKFFKRALVDFKPNGHTEEAHIKALKLVYEGYSEIMSKVEPINKK